MQAASANLHRDMLAASSPASSIQSRMNLDLASPVRDQKVPATGFEEQSYADGKMWRYSIAPEALALSAVDVREPLPSPTLPNVLTHEMSVGNDDTAEPVSSGFTTPHNRCSLYNSTEAITMALRPAQTSAEDNINDVTSKNLTASRTCNETNLERTMMQLYVSGEEPRNSSSEDSPILSHLKRRSCGTSMEIQLGFSPKQYIYLSETAEAAA